ncbi:E3 ubiquitin-protein ligase PDZRN3 isoform X2 [Octopus sinensis]|uniref:E3 ubiquitin-protein ligase PDZRN3 isoform X2 n=1 Tax=Octopus sinensis TaxID=2607531 RepID=A0A6P7SEE6_9MOLL|nr:E3 ubiquitin-protein ligase PDZRN3 isoform X2 [Octopus sinensis]
MLSDQNLLSCCWCLGNFGTKLVNGQDLSQSTHEEAVEAFRSAKEPIVVEVLRRANKAKMKSRSPTMVSVGTQTEEEIFCSNESPPTPPPGFYAFNGSGLYQPSSRRPVAFSPSADMGLTDIEMAHAYEFEDPYFDDDRAYDMEYEEVILHRDNNEKLGLTLCYGSLDDDMTDIFIGEVESDSIAAKDGRIHPGDQILQINGVELHGRNQAIKLFTESTLDICLLVARHQIQMDDGFMEEHNMVLDDILEEQHHEKMQFMAGMLNEVHMDEEGATTDTGMTENSCLKLEKDSGVGRTDESTKNEESSEQETFDGESVCPASLQFGTEGEFRQRHESFTSTDQDYVSHEIPVDVCDRFREVLEDRCGSPRKERSRKDSQGSINRELAMLDKEMKEIQMECQELVRAHMREQQKIQLQQREMLRYEPQRSPRIVPRMGTRLEYIKHTGLTHEQAESSNNARKESNQTPKLIPQSMITDKEKDPATTSAYNSGESCRSTPLTLELNQVSDDSDKGLRNSMLCLVPPAGRTSGSDTEKQTQTPTKAHDHSSDDSLKLKKNLSFTQNSSKVNHRSGNLKSCESMGESLQDIYMRYSDVMYTNHANLEHTIAIQQKLFQQQLEQRSRIKGHSSSGGRGSDGQQGEACAGAQSSDGCQMEWVVKRRPDGTRYITRRPIRNKMLKERAKKISEERAGMTTDDDAMSELKVGRYWPKEERKKHIEKARDQKRKKELMMKAKMETLKEEDKKEVNILELSHRKMLKHKGKKVLDDFVTVQEMLAHGSRVAEGKTYNPLLSVTTV